MRFVWNDRIGFEHFLNRMTEEFGGMKANYIWMTMQLRKASLCFSAALIDIPKEGLLYAVYHIEFQVLH